MRIGIMLRSLEERGGVGVYTHNILRELLDYDRTNQYVLFYRHPRYLGRFSHYPNVTERHVKGSNKVIWDQLAIPLACWREKVDVVFHPKFTLPLLARCKAVMVVHGADWFLPEHAQYYQAWDIRYIRLFMPLYFRKAARVISVSKLTTENFKRILNLPPGKIQTVYFAPARHFRRVEDRATQEAVKSLYRLPASFILTLSKSKGGERKNIGQIFKAYQRYHQTSPTPYKLVVGGEGCEIFRQTYGLPKRGFGEDILFPGWIAQEDLPAIYSMAAMFLYPSNLEAFPIPLTEAMACGAPIITSNVNGLDEIIGEAGIKVDPSDEAAIAQAIHNLSTDENARAAIASEGLKRAAMFSWDRCARETLDVLESAVGAR